MVDAGGAAGAGWCARWGWGGASGARPLGKRWGVVGMVTNVTAWGNRWGWCAHGRRSWGLGRGRHVAERSVRGIALDSMLCKRGCWCTQMVTAALGRLRECHGRRGEGRGGGLREGRSGVSKVSGGWGRRHGSGGCWQVKITVARLRGIGASGWWQGGCAMQCRSWHTFTASWCVHQLGQWVACWWCGFCPDAGTPVGREGGWQVRLLDWSCVGQCGGCIERNGAVAQALHHACIVGGAGAGAGGRQSETGRPCGAWAAWAVCCRPASLPPHSTKLHMAACMHANVGPGTLFTWGCCVCSDDHEGFPA